MENSAKITKIGNSAEKSYRAAKILRQGNRELERQLNIKKTKKG